MITFKELWEVYTGLVYFIAAKIGLTEDDSKQTERELRRNKGEIVE